MEARTPGGQRHNYALVLMGAIFALANLGTGSPSIPEKIVLSLRVFPEVVVVVGLLFLHLQLHLYNARERPEKLENTFSQEDQSLVNYEPGPVTNTNIIGPMKIIGQSIEMIEKIDKGLRYRSIFSSSCCAALQARISPIAL